MCEILIFGGTTEGRLLGEFCEKRGIPAWLSVASEYGRESLGETKYLRVVQGRMECAQMKAFFDLHGIRLVIDATHPYAKQVSEQAREACLDSRIRLVRCLRGETEKPALQSGEKSGERGGGRTEETDRKDSGIRGIRVPDIESAAAFLETVGGPVLVTTGSRGLAAFTRISNYRERIYARVLPSSAVLRQCEELGISGKHLIGMQGPFSREMNEALLRQIGAAWMVTKESGAAGGFQEKLDAAAACGVRPIVIQRPRENGLPFEEVCRILESEGRGSKGNKRERQEEERQGQEGEGRDKQGRDGQQRDGRACAGFLTLAGIGAGASGQMTADVREAILDCDAVLGAGRMLQAAESVLGKGPRPVLINSYREQELLSLIRAHPEWKKVTVLYSGDPGFYSGASSLAGLLRRDGVPFRILPGISSVSYFAAKLLTSWEDASLYTAHGRTADIETMMGRGEPKIIILMGGENGAGVFLSELKAAGYGSLSAAVGENLSYPNERIRRGTVSELARENYDALSLIMIERKAEE